MSAEKTLTLLLPRVEELRASLANIYTMKQDNSSDDKIRSALTSCALQIVSMKSLSRKVYHLKNEHMQEVQGAKKRVEETSLRLQNLQYEKNQLLNEIRRCRDFVTTETNNVDLMTTDKYYKDTGLKPKKKMSGAGGATSEDANHKLYLERLAHELAQRKQLAEKLAEIAKHTKQVDRATSFKIKFLSDLKSKLKVVEDSTRPLQEFFGDQVTQLNETHERAACLPEPLYVLYRQLDSFAQTFGRKQVASTTTKAKKSSSSSKSSSTTAAAAASSSSTSSFSSAYDETAEGIDIQLSIVPAVPYSNGGVLTQNVSASTLGKRDRVPPVYKDAVLTTMTATAASGGYLTIRFQYVPSLTKVTCVVVDSSEVVPYNLLNELYCRDLSDAIVTGDHRVSSSNVSSTTPSKKTKGTKGGAASSGNGNGSGVDDVGVSYLWAQWLSGLYRLSAGSGSTTTTTMSTTIGDRAWNERRVRPSTSSLLHTIMARRLRASLLMSQIHQMNQGVHPVAVPPCVMAACFPEHRDPQARLTKFAVIVENDKKNTVEEEKTRHEVVPCLSLQTTFERKFSNVISITILFAPILSLCVVVVVVAVLVVLFAVLVLVLVLVVYALFLALTCGVVHLTFSLLSGMI